MKKIVLHQENIEILLESLLNKNDADSLKILEEYQLHDGEIDTVSSSELTDEQFGSFTKK